MISVLYLGSLLAIPVWMKFSPRKILVLLTAAVCLGHLYGPVVERRLACVETPRLISALDLGTFPIQSDMLTHVQSDNQEHKKKFVDNYNWLTMIEFESRVMLDRARSGYGMNGPLFTNPSPIRVNNFDPTQNMGYVANPTGWGSFNNSVLNGLFPGPTGTIANLMGRPDMRGVIQPAPAVIPPPFLIKSTF